VSCSIERTNFAGLALFVQPEAIKSDMADDTETTETSGAAATCTNCDGSLIFLGSKDFHEGTRAWGFIFGDFGELFTGGEEIEMWTCELCGHIDFFMPKK
jgi:hypothetical protein